MSILRVDSLQDTNGEVTVNVVDLATKSDITAKNKSVKDFGAVGDGVANDTQAFIDAGLFSVETGQTITVTPGNYFLINASFGGSFDFAEGAVIVSTLGANDNVLVPLSGLKMKGAVIKKSHTSFAPDGDWGNGIRLGAYRQPLAGTATNDIHFDDLEIHCLTPTIYGQAIEVLGDVYNVSFKNVKLYGAGGGMICHWGGDVGSDGHSSTITYTYHPHNITIDNLQAFPDAFGNATTNALILSAAYDIKVNGMYTEGVTRTLWAFPGDVYNTVAVARDKAKICTGIIVRGAIANLPADAANQPAIHVSGMPATPRTSTPASFGVDDDVSMGFDIEAVINCGTKSYANPVAIVEGISQSKIKISKTGSSVGGNWWARVRYCNRIDAEFNGWSHQGVQVNGVMGSSININGVCPEASDLDVARGADIATYVSAAFTTVSTLSLSSTTVTLTPSASQVIFAGTYLTSGGVPVARATKSFLTLAGVNITVPIQAVSASVSAGSSIAFSMPCEGTKITGSLEGFRNNYVLTNAWGVTLDVDSRASKQNSIVFAGNYIRGVVIRGTAERTARIGDPGYADILVPSGVSIRGLDISMSFDVGAANPNVGARFQYSGTDHAGLVLHNVYATSTPGGVAFQVNNSTVSGAANQLQVYANKVDDNQVPFGTLTGIYMGKTWVGSSRSGSIPTTGYWAQGSRIYLDSVTAGGQEGYICTVSGTPGTWKGFGSISA